MLLQKNPFQEKLLWEILAPGFGQIDQMWKTQSNILKYKAQLLIYNIDILNLNSGTCTQNCSHVRPSSVQDYGLLFGTNFLSPKGVSHLWRLGGISSREF